MRIRVIDVVHKATKDIDESKGIDAKEFDGLVNRSVGGAKRVLDNPLPTMSEFQRYHLAGIFESLGQTHATIRELLKHGANSPISADALPVARLQIEMLYPLCLTIEDSQYIDWYLKHSWRQTYVRYLLQQQETDNLPRFRSWIEGEARGLLDKLRIIAGVTDAERATIDSEELGQPVPPGMTAVPIPMFPTPKIAIRRALESSRKQMLMRLYPEYQVLSSYVHGSSSQLRISKSLLNPRSKYRRYFSSAGLDNLFQRVAEEAIWLSYLSIVQSCTELIELYPGDTDLRVTLVQAWNPIVEGSLLGRAIWEIRSSFLLGVLPHVHPSTASKTLK